MLKFLLRILGFLPEKRAEINAPVVEPKNTKINAIEGTTGPIPVENVAVEPKTPQKRGRKPRQTTGKKSKA